MTSVRLPWDDIPAEVRHAVEAALGAPVVEAVNQKGGYGPSLAARCRLADGRRMFVKAAAPSVNEQTVWMLRAELAATAAMPSELPVPRLRHTYDDGSWVVGVFDEIDGEPPPTPWDPDTLALVLAAVEDLGERADPSPVPSVPAVTDRLGPLFGMWRLMAAHGTVPGEDEWAVRHLDRLAALEATWAAGAAGTALVHGDIRADNLLVDRDGRVWFVDWAHACVGPSWVDLLLMLPSVALEGGPEPEALWAASRASRAADPDTVTAVVAAFDGYFTYQSRQPDPPGLPFVRAFQAAQGEVTRRWLQQRTGWH